MWSTSMTLWTKTWGGTGGDSVEHYDPHSPHPRNCIEQNQRLGHGLEVQECTSKFPLFSQYIPLPKYFPSSTILSLFFNSSYIFPPNFLSLLHYCPPAFPHLSVLLQQLIFLPSLNGSSPPNFYSFLPMLISSQLSSHSSINFNHTPPRFVLHTFTLIVAFWTAWEWKLPLMILHVLNMCIDMNTFWYWWYRVICKWWVNNLINMSVINVMQLSKEYKIISTQIIEALR